MVGAARKASEPQAAERSHFCREFVLGGLVPGI
jgi:hypothetical protein